MIFIPSPIGGCQTRLETMAIRDCLRDRFLHLIFCFWRLSCANEKGRNLKEVLKEVCKHTLQWNREIRSASSCEMCQVWRGFWATRGDIWTSTFSRAPCEGDTMLVSKNMHGPWFGRSVGNIAWNAPPNCSMWPLGRSAKFCFGWDPFVVDQRSYSYSPIGCF